MINTFLSLAIALPLTVVALSAFLFAGTLLHAPMPFIALVFAAAFWVAFAKLRRIGLLVGAIGWSLYVLYEGYLTWIDQAVIRIDLFLIVLPLLFIVTTVGLWSAIQWWMERRKRG